MMNERRLPVHVIDATQSIDVVRTNVLELINLRNPRRVLSI